MKRKIGESKLMENKSKFVNFRGSIIHVDDVKILQELEMYCGFESLNFATETMKYGLGRRGIIFKSETGNITGIFIYGIKMELIPNIIFDFKKLKVLDIHFTNLKMLSENVEKLYALEELYINKNPIEELPKNIVKLSNLKVLDISFNKIKFLPKNMHLLRELRRIDISFNPISEIPLSIVSMKKLKKIFLTRKNLSNDSKKIIGKLDKHILKERYHSL